jgi:4a-hydroxytetrahydrobiopterin dehydratase
MADTISGEALATALTEFPGWEPADDGKTIVRKFVFANFNAAFGFMARAALIAEKSDHHPDWTNVYKTVVVTLSTHDAGGVTAKDLTLARAMDKIAGECGI